MIALKTRDWLDKFTTIIVATDQIKMLDENFRD